MAEFSTNAKGNTALGFGIAGTALGLLAGHANGNGNGWGLFGGNGTEYVSRETFDKQNEISSLNSKIALLEAEKDSEKKMIDVYERVTARILENERSYATDKAAQQVVNANVQSAIAVNTNNINQLMGLTRLIVPASSVCPQPMPQYNSWTAPNASGSSAT